MASIPEEMIPLLSELDSGCLVLTPNHLSSVQLLDWYGSYRRERGMGSVFPRPAVFPIDIWIRRQCAALLDSGSEHLPAVSMLDPEQECILWHDIISRSESGSRLLNPAATTAAVQEAWTLVHLWRITPEELQAQAAFHTGTGHDDLEAFLEWSGSFAAFCRERQLATQVEMLERLITLVGAKVVALPDQAVLVGFRNPPPLYRQLLEAIGSATAARHAGYPEQRPAVRVAPCADEQVELQAAADWARRVIAQDPDARVGIVMDGLHRRRAQVQRVFSRCFTPEESRSLLPRTHYPFSLSAGRPLGRIPLVQAALRFLGRNRFTVDTL